MRPFAYARAATLDDALHAAREPGIAVLAGGTELLNWLRLGIAEPDRVLDISHIAGLDRIEPLAGGGLRIGALVRLNDLAADERVARVGRCCARRSTSRRRPSCATSRRSARTCCRRRAAHTFAPRTR
jgi:CO/xanthine dehydrogenase FAD-binding subunit